MMDSANNSNNLNNPNPHETIRRFVQGTLGCGCEDAVFVSIECQRPAEEAGEPRLQLVIGGRLLIQVRSAGAGLEQALPGWITAGVHRRDEQRLNRLRLVLCPEAGMAAAVQTAAQRCALPDARVHLHVLPAATVMALEQALAA